MRSLRYERSKPCIQSRVFWSTSTFRCIIIFARLFFYFAPNVIDRLHIVPILKGNVRGCFVLCFVFHLFWITVHPCVHFSIDVCCLSQCVLIFALPTRCICSSDRKNCPSSDLICTWLFHSDEDYRSSLPVPCTTRCHAFPAQCFPILSNNIRELSFFFADLAHPS